MAEFFFFPIRITCKPKRWIPGFDGYSMKYFICIIFIIFCISAVKRWMVLIYASATTEILFMCAFNVHIIWITWNNSNFMIHANTIESKSKSKCKRKSNKVKHYWNIISIAYILWGVQLCFAVDIWINRENEYYLRKTMKLMAKTPMQQW